MAVCCVRTSAFKAGLLTQQLGSISAAPLARTLKIGLVYNKHSGRHQKRWGTQKFPDGIPAIQAKTPAQVHAALEQLAEQQVNLLVIAGGDGTVQSVLSEVMLNQNFEHRPLIALIPTGSTNMTGTDVGTVDLRHGGWQRLQEWATNPCDLQQRIVHRPVLKIEPGGSRPAFCGMFFGAGAIYHAVQHTQKNLHGLGLRGDVGPGLALMRFAKSVAGRDRRYFNPVNVSVRDADGRTVEGENILLLASTLNRLLLNLHPFWGQEDAPVHWTTVAEGARGFLRKLPAVCRGQGKKLRPEHGYTSHNSERIELLFDGGFIVDGEFFEARIDDGPVVLSSAGDAAFLNL